MTVELDAIVERLAAEAAGGEGVEAYAELTTETSVTAFQGEVERLTSASSSGVGVRVVKDGRLGYAYTADTSDGGLRECLAEARANLEVSGRTPATCCPTRPPTSRWTACSTPAWPRPTPSARSPSPSTWRPAPGPPTPRSPRSSRPATATWSARWRSPPRWGWRARSRSATPGASRSPWPPRTARARSATRSTPPAPSTTSTRARWPARRPTGRCACWARPSRRPGRCRWCSTGWSLRACSGCCWPACRPRRCRSGAACSPTGSASGSARPASSWSTTAAWSPAPARPRSTARVFPPGGPC